MGLYEIDGNGSCVILSIIKTQSAIHYPDLQAINDELYMSWSEDRRYIDRRVARSDIAFSKIMVE